MRALTRARSVRPRLRIRGRGARPDCSPDVLNGGDVNGSVVSLVISARRSRLNVHSGTPQQTHQDCRGSPVSLVTPWPAQACCLFTSRPPKAGAVVVHAVAGIDHYKKLGVSRGFSGGSKDFYRLVEGKDRRGCGRLQCDGPAVSLRIISNRRCGHDNEDVAVLLGKTQRLKRGHRQTAVE